MKQQNKIQQRIEELEAERDKWRVSLPRKEGRVKEVYEYKIDRFELELKALKFAQEEVAKAIEEVRKRQNENYVFIHSDKRVNAFVELFQHELKQKLGIEAKTGKEKTK